MRRVDLLLSGFRNRVTDKARIYASVLMLLCTGSVSLQAVAQSERDFTVDVVVADQSSQQRDSAYWLAFDQVLRRNVETRIRVETDQRKSLLKNASAYVQSFRYRRFDSIADSVRLSTRSVREGAAAGAVIMVTFPADLAAIVQQQLVPEAVVEEAPVVQPVMALVAVELGTNQFIIGGDRGKKFQARALQLAAANNLQLEFPVLEPSDSELITAADLLAGDVERIANFVKKLDSNSYLTGALYRLNEDTWQSDWSYTEDNAQPQSFGLSTETLDEALVAAMTQISPTGGFLASPYAQGSDAAFQRSGFSVRVENIRSLADYDNVLALLRRLDSDIVTEKLESDSMVFRGTDQSAARVRDSLIADRSFEPLEVDQFGEDLSFRYQAR